MEKAKNLIRVSEYGKVFHSFGVLFILDAINERLERCYS
jgi:hypothetical protein